MALVFIVPSWLLLLSLIVGLCRAARLGDSQGPQAPAACSTRSGVAAARLKLGKW